MIKKTTEADTELLVIADLRVEGEKGERGILHFMD